MSGIATEAQVSALTSDEILRIARLDAEVAYRDLSHFRIRLERLADGWHVDYELVGGKLMAGGGPHYVIDPTSGAIHSKRYGQ